MDERAGASPSLTYTTRRSVLTPETTWRLTPKGLVREPHGEAPSSGWTTFLRIAWRLVFVWWRPPDETDWPESVAYAEILEIRTRFDPTRFDRNRRRCDVKTAGGARISIFSTRFAGPGDFEDESASYDPFIEELTRRVIAARPETPVYTGLSWTSYVVQHGLLLIALLALASILGAAGLPAFGTIWVKMLIVLSYAGLLWSYARRNLPGKRNPISPPERRNT